MSYLEIEHKEDSPEKLAATAGVPSKHLLKADEMNQIVAAINGLAVNPASKFTSNPIPSIVGTDILVPEDETWLIDSVPYTNPTVSTIPFDYAPDGLLYFLTVVATKFNTFTGKFGTASTDPSEPTINNDELFLTTYLISDGTIEVVIPPVNPNIYVEKESFAPLTLISSGHVASIELDKRNNLIFSGNITKTGNVIKNNSNHFVIGLPFTTTNKTANPIEIQHLNTSGGSGSVAYFNTEELSYFLQPNEVAIWISEILNGQKIHRRVSSYIDRDSVIYRSGTKVGKDIVGDLKFSSNAGLITEEFGGLQSKIYERNGKWNIEVLNGIENPTIYFDPDKGIFSDKLFDIDNDENAYLQKGHIVQLEEDVFNLELNKADLVGGLVPSSQLPAYVDDIIEGYLLSGVFYKEDTHTTSIAGEIGKIYVDLTTGQKSRQYRWSGTVYIQITNGLIASTDDVPEGSNLYFTTARVLSTLLTGLSLVTGGAIVSTDSVLVAFGKVQKQLNDFGTALGLKQDTLNEDNFGTFTNSVGDKATQANTDVLAYVDITTGKWVKQTFTNLTAFLKGFFVDKTTAQSIDGIKTFTASPIVPTATEPTGAVNLQQLQASQKLHAVFIDNNLDGSVSLTGTTAITIVKPYVFPANYFPADCVVEASIKIRKIGTAGNMVFSFGKSESAVTLPFHSVISIPSSALQMPNTTRTVSIKNDTMVGFGTSGNFFNDNVTSSAAMLIHSFNVTISNTFNLTFTLGNASDTMILESLIIKVYKNA